jgi:hypothetical protein
VAVKVAILNFKGSSMTKPFMAWSRILAVLAVLMLDRPPCMGEVCCDVKVAALPSGSASTEVASCCKVTHEQEQPREVERLAGLSGAIDDCPCCTAPPSNSNLPTRTESRVGPDQGDPGIVAPTPFVSSRPVEVVHLGRDFRVPSPGKTPLHIRLAHLRN